MPPIQGLWIGAPLSVMERLSIASFLHHGHPYHLYVYEDVGEVPPGTQLEDARDIMPASRIFQYQRHATYAGFSNLFRYQLLASRGGWWVDTDTVCLRPFDFASPHVFCSEVAHGETRIASGIVRAPAGSTIMTLAGLACARIANPAEAAWGSMGPKLMAKLVDLMGLHSKVMPPQTFCPVDCEDWRQLVQPGRDWHFSDQTYAVHLWNEMWRRAGMDKNQVHPADCLYERLKLRYLK